MALLGQLSDTYDESATPERRELASALRALHTACGPISMLALGKHLGYSPAAISHFFHARRVPSVTTIGQLHALARRLGRREPRYTMSDLRQLRDLAQRRVTRPSPSETRPAARRGYRRNSSADVTTAARGYRRNTNPAAPHTASVSGPSGQGSTIDSLIGLPRADRIAALWHVGGQLSIDELAEACATLIRHAMQDEVAVLLDAARINKKSASGE